MCSCATFHSRSRPITLERTTICLVQHTHTQSRFQNVNKSHTKLISISQSRTLTNVVGENKGTYFVLGTLVKKKGRSY